MRKIKKVLVVDDDEAALFLAKKVLNRIDIAEEIVSANNGLEAFQMVRDACEDGAQGFPELMLVDLKMPVMNGFKLIEAMGGLTMPVQPIIVVLTSSENTIDREKARNLKTDGYLIKPISQEAIEALLSELMA